MAMDDRATLQHHRWENVREEVITPLITRRAIHTAGMTVVQLTYKKGAVVALHSHVHEQATTLLEGALRLEVGDQPVLLKPGETLCVPSNVPHRAEALEDSRAMEVFVPARTDWT
jgi:quercetin dioxygenase-like cupin family protein